MTNPQVTGSATFNFDYTNQDGVSHTSKTCTCNTATAIGSLINTATTIANASNLSPFIALADGDTGVRSIETFRMVAGSDVGLICLVLVKPLASTYTREITAPNETDYLKDGVSLPVVQDGAYLNWIAYPKGSLASTAIHGDATFIWS
jgi:hypothetical protein